MPYLVAKSKAFMLRTLSAAVTLLLLYTCQAPPKQDAPNLTSINALISRYLQEKQIDSFLAAADQKLSLLGDNPDSLHAWVNLNRYITESLHANNRGWPATRPYLENMIRQAEKYPADTSLRRSLTFACAQWAFGYDSKNDEPRDSMIRYYEKAIELNHSTGELSAPDERYIYKMLGVLYNMLGDTKKSLSYYTLQQKGMVRKSNTLAGLAINTSIALRESGLTDSAIRAITEVLPLRDINPVKRGDLLTTLSEAQLQKGWIAEAEKSAEAALLLLTALADTTELNGKIVMVLKQKGILERINGWIHRLKAVGSTLVT